MLILSIAALVMFTSLVLNAFASGPIPQIDVQANLVRGMEFDPAPARIARSAGATVLAKLRALRTRPAAPQHRAA